MLTDGTPAPDIQLQTDTAAPFRLSSLQGKRIVLYFFPRADTSG
jgi:thioredoxin-dependent peroxiredoxin